MIQKALILCVLQAAAFIVASAAPSNGVLGDLPTMRQISEEARKQQLLLPDRYGQVKLFSFAGNGYVYVKQQNNVNQLPLKIRKSSNYAHSIFYRSDVLETANDKLVSFITNKAAEAAGENLPTGRIERLVRQGNYLVAKVASESEAAHFMIKRYPSVCNDTGINYIHVKPQFVQLMLVDLTYNAPYHRALLNVHFNFRNQPQLQLLTADNIPDECDYSGFSPSPSVHAGTLFTLSYGSNMFYQK